MVHGYKEGGFKPNKYRIEKTSGNPVDPEARYFVLRYDKDPHALVALEAYAKSVYRDNDQLGHDLLDVVREIREQLGLANRY